MVRRRDLLKAMAFAPLAGFIPRPAKAAESTNLIFEWSSITYPPGLPDGRRIGLKVTRPDGSKWGYIGVIEDWRAIVDRHDVKQAFRTDAMLTSRLKMVALEQAGRWEESRQVWHRWELLDAEIEADL